MKTSPTDRAAQAPNVRIIYSADGPRAKATPLLDILNFIGALVALDPPLHAGTLRVGTVLARHYNHKVDPKTGRGPGAWPSAKTIAKEARVYSLRIPEALKELVERGCYTIEPGRKGRGCVTVYRPNFGIVENASPGEAFVPAENASPLTPENASLSPAKMPHFDPEKMPHQVRNERLRGNAIENAKGGNGARACARGTPTPMKQLDEDWRPRSETLERARGFGLPDEALERAISRFRNCHRAKGTTFADPDPAFLLWSEEDAAKLPAKPQPAEPSREQRRKAVYYYVTDTYVPPPDDEKLTRIVHWYVEWLNDLELRDAILSFLQRHRIISGEADMDGLIEKMEFTETNE